MRDRVVCLQGSTAGACLAAGVFAASYFSQLAPLRRMVIPKATSMRPGSMRVNSTADFLKDIAPHVIIHGAALSVADVTAGFAYGYFEAEDAPAASEGKPST